MTQQKKVVWKTAEFFSKLLFSRLLAAPFLVSIAATAQAPLDIRIALVIGNSAYAGSAALSNPANDAAAMGAALRRLGFTVIELRDGSRAQMVEAVSTISSSLKGKQGVGMLYYAGHGLQVDWRNYMVPIDARMSVAADVLTQTIGIDTVINAFKTAGNRMNIVVLDACRDNPFLGTGSIKGLAQLDAPPGTFLAYATAPGNVAEDGTSGSNGLYTGYLVQELAKPAARIEDVFKRVRLQVRQKSNGRQIPWESTSLEDDFYFNDGTKFTLKAEDLEKLASEARLKEQLLLRQAAQARDKERQIVQELERERQQLALAARQAEEQRALAKEKIQEAEQLSQQERIKEQARLAAQAKEREEKSRLEELQAREREKQLARAQQEESVRVAASNLALQIARQTENERLNDLALARAEEQARAQVKLSRTSGQEATEKEFVREKADWDLIGGSRSPDDFYAFLKKYPNGKISELASATLERIARAQITPVANREGVVQIPARDRYRVGDVYAFTVRDDLTKIIVREGRARVTQITEDTVVLGTGGAVLTREGGTIRNEFISNMDPPRLDLPSGDYAIGKKWAYRSLQSNYKGPSFTVEGEVKIVALEDVTVAAGTVKAYRLELSSISGNGERVKLTRWMQPDWGFPIKMLREIRPRSGPPTLETWEMTSRNRGSS